MRIAKLTLEAIDRKAELEQEDGFRNHLGASVIGKSCARECWYGYRWAIREQFTGQRLRLFNTGHLYEKRFTEYLESIGVKVFAFDAEKSKAAKKEIQWRVSCHDGHFGGSLDGIAVGVPDLPQDVPCTVSFKTHNQTSFDKLREMGVMGSKFGHFVQEQTYMGFLDKSWNIQDCLYLAVNKNTDELHAELIRFDSEVFKTTCDRAADVIYQNAPLPRIANSPGAFACKLCLYNRMCHFGDVTPAQNCRTCKYSRPGHNGLWKCGLRHIDLDEKAQKAGCEGYQVNQKLVGPQP